MQIIDEILSRFDERDHREYGESLTQLNHALQTPPPIDHYIPHLKASLR